MPKNHRIPSYRLHKPSGRAVVTLGGKDQYLGRYKSAASKREYARLIAEHSAGSGLADADGLTVSELIAAYLKHAAAFYRRDDRPTGETTNIKAAMRHVRRLYASTPAVNFGPRALKAVVQAMIDDGKVRQNINRNQHRIRRMFKWAVAEELLPSSVYEALRAVDGLRAGRSAAVEGQPVRPVDDALVDAIKPHVNPVVWDMIQVQRWTGMRAGELVIMRGIDIDTTGKVWLYRPERHKTAHHGHDRIIELGPRAQKVLASYLKPGFLFSPADAERQRRERLTAQRTTPLSCGNKVGSNRKRRPQRAPGDRYDVASYRRAIARGCDLAFPVPKGLDGDAAKAWRRDHRWHPHRLRHTFATRVRRQYGLEAARAALGQSTIAAAEIYSEIDREQCKAIALKIG